MHFFFVGRGMKIVGFEIHPAEPFGQHAPDGGFARPCHSHHEKNHELPVVDAAPEVQRSAEK
jgi:hypothetical protein